MTHLRLKAALCTSVLAASLATPTLESAFASNPSVPALPDISAALSAAGIGSVSSVLTELTNLQGLAPGGSLGLLGLGSLDNALTTLNGGLLGSLLTPVLTLLASLNPAAPSSLSQTLADLEQIGSAPGASSAVVAAVDELTATLTTAGLGQILTQVSGLTAGQDTSALSALAGLQSLPLGGSVSAGSLAPVGTVLSTLAGEPGAGAAASLLNSAAATLNGSGAISPTALLGVIGQIQSAASSLPAPLNGVATALAAQLAASSSLFGQLASVGGPLSSGSVTSALAGLGGLPGLTAGASVPGGSLAPVAAVLTALAGEPGVPAPAASVLTSVAATLNGAGAIDPGSLLGLITSLQGVSGLPSPLGSVVSELTSALGSSGSIFGGVPGLSALQVTGALSALQGLPGLVSGASVPGGVLAPVGGILSQVAAQPGVPAPAASVLSTVAGALGGSGGLSPASLTGLIGQLQSVSGSLPAPLSTVVSDIAGLLSASGSLTGSGGSGGGTGGGTGGSGGGTGGSGGGTGGGTGGSGSGSGGLGGSGSGSGSGSGGTGGLGGSGSGSGGGSGSGSGGLGGGSGLTGSRAGHARISRVQRSGQVLIVTLQCTASSNLTCRTTVSAAQGGVQLSHATLTLRGGSTKRVRLHLRASAVAALTRHRRAVSIRITARTGSYRTTMTLR